MTASGTCGNLVLFLSWDYVQCTLGGKIVCPAQLLVLHLVRDVQNVISAVLVHPKVCCTWLGAPTGIDELEISQLAIVRVELRLTINIKLKAKTFVMS